MTALASGSHIGQIHEQIWPELSTFGHKTSSNTNTSLTINSKIWCISSWSEMFKAN